MDITAAQLRKIMPTLPTAKAAVYVPPLNAAMAEFDIATAQRIAAFLAQVAHESSELRYWRELASGKAYEGRHDLGNTQPGDGVRYKGRGPIQITGRANYEAVGAALGLDLLAHPELLETPEPGFRSAAHYWQTHGLNELADQETLPGFVAITRRINGGVNGLESRRNYWARARAALA